MSTFLWRAECPRPVLPNIRTRLRLTEQFQYTKILLSSVRQNVYILGLPLISSPFIQSSRPIKAQLKTTLLKAFPPSLKHPNTQDNLYPSIITMRILLLGANGRTGSLVLAEALSRSYTVTALVRRPDSLEPQANLSITTGSPLSQADIAKAFASPPNSDPITVVISALNNGRTGDNPWSKPTAPANLMADAVRNSLAVMRRYDVKKIVVLGSIGVGSSRANSGWFFNWVVDHSNMKITFDDHNVVQQVLETEAEKDPELKWVDVRSVGLSNGEKKAVKEFGNEGKGAGSWVSRKSVAGFIVDAVESGRWDGQTPVISN